MDHSHHDMVSSTASAIASMTMSAVASATSAASSHDMHNMNEMDMSDSSSSSSGSSMHMMSTMGAFHWSSSGDAIWLESWIPQSEGAYIGACFGLFFVSVLSRSLPAMESYFVAWRGQQTENIRLNNNTVAVDNKDVRCDVEKSSNLESHSSSQSFNPAQYPKPLTLPIIPAFCWKTDTVRSFLTTVTSFVSYLLMMVVMTGNGGFFLVIIIGVFVGEMAFGRFRALGGWQGGEHNH